MRTILVADFEFTVHDAGPGRPRAFFPEVIEAGAVRMVPAGVYGNSGDSNLCETAILSEN